MRSSVATILWLFLTIAPVVPYDGDKLVVVKVHDTDEWTTVREILQEKSTFQAIDILREPSAQSGKATIHLHANDAHTIISSLHDKHVTVNVTVEDLGKLIREHLLANDAAKAARQDIVGTYARYDEIISWIGGIAEEFPEVASVVSIGNSLEGRDTRALRLGLPSGSDKWQIWIDGGVHAREWISPASVVYIIDQLMQAYDNGDETVTEYLQKFDFIILPVANPDGYEYCFTDERLWRKNRRVNEGSTCMGVDLNRNWAYQWGGVNADTDPCSNLFMGPAPESEPEVKNIVNFIMANNEKYIMYLSYHAWGQQFFTRWDYTDEELPEDHEELLSLAERSVDAMVAQHGLFWEAGTAPDLMYAFAGGSADWSRGVADIKYPYLLELRDDGDYAFELPPEQIIPQGEEVWAGLQVIMEEIVNNWGDVAPPTRR